MDKKGSVLKYSVVGVTSADPRYSIDNITSDSPQGAGWRSAPGAQFPQEIVVKFSSAVLIQCVVIVIHEKYRPTRIELYIGDQAAGPEGTDVNFRRLGYIAPDNKRLPTKREKQSVQLDVRGSYLKLVIPAAAPLDVNTTGQVSVVSLVVRGEEPGNSSPTAPPAIAAPPPAEQPKRQPPPSDPHPAPQSAQSRPQEEFVQPASLSAELRQRMERFASTHDAPKRSIELMRQSLQSIDAIQQRMATAVEKENYIEAERCKVVAERIAELVDLLQQLEDNKEQAVRACSFLAAKELKDQIDQIKAALSYDVDGLLMNLSPPGMAPPPEEAPIRPRQRRNEPAQASSGSSAPAPSAPAPSSQASAPAPASSGYVDPDARVIRGNPSGQYTLDSNAGPEDIPLSAMNRGGPPGGVAVPEFASDETDAEKERRLRNQERARKQREREQQLRAQRQQKAGQGAATSSSAPKPEATKPEPKVEQKLSLARMLSQAQLGDKAPEWKPEMGRDPLVGLVAEVVDNETAACFSGKNGAVMGVATRYIIARVKEPDFRWNDHASRMILALLQHLVSQQSLTVLSCLPPLLEDFSQLLLERCGCQPSEKGDPADGIKQTVRQLTELLSSAQGKVAPTAIEIVSTLCRTKVMGPRVYANQLVDPKSVHSEASQNAPGRGAAVERNAQIREQRIFSMRLAAADALGEALGWTNLFGQPPSRDKDRVDAKRMANASLSCFAKYSDPQVRTSALKMLGDIYAVPDNNVDEMAQWLADTTDPRNTAANAVKLTKPQLQSLVAALTTAAQKRGEKQARVRIDDAGQQLIVDSALTDDSLAAQLYIQQKPGESCCPLCGQKPPEIPQELLDAANSSGNTNAVQQWLQEQQQQHFVTDCPMVTPCVLCHQFVDIPLMTNHLQSECPIVDRETGQRPYTLCSGCGCLYETTKIQQHRAECTQHLDFSKVFVCPACYNHIPATPEAIRSHYLTPPGCPCNPRTAHWRDGK